MAKDDASEVDGVVQEALPNAGWNWKTGTPFWRIFPEKCGSFTSASFPAIGSRWNCRRMI